MAHTNQEIPKEQWASYFAGITERIRNQRVRVESITLESLSLDTGDQEIARSLPLVDISLERKGSDLGAVQIIAGHGDDEITHRVLEPERITAELDADSGELECLEIAEKGGGKLLVFFERAHEAEEPTVRA